jgi:hypothetical protein
MLVVPGSLSTRYPVLECCARAGSMVPPAVKGVVTVEYYYYYIFIILLLCCYSNDMTPEEITNEIYRTSTQNPHERPIGVYATRMRLMHTHIKYYTEII